MLISVVGHLPRVRHWQSRDYFRHSYQLPRNGRSMVNLQRQGKISHVLLGCQEGFASLRPKIAHQPRSWPCINQIWTEGNVPSCI